VRRAMKRGGLNIELRNINKNDDHQQELINQGGKRKVPCLKITDSDQKVTWMYESDDIVNYLATLTV
jgi:glutathione S-transferase